MQLHTELFSTPRKSSDGVFHLDEKDHSSSVLVAKDDREISSPRSLVQHRTDLLVGHCHHLRRAIYGRAHRNR